MSQARWRGAPFLAALRPRQGWRARAAVLAAYSAEPVVLTAAILALGDKADEAGRGSPAAKVEALTGLQGRLRFVLQRGRLRVPDRPGPALALLDHYVREVPLDEGSHSWHPKLVVVEFEQPDAPEEREVRVWLGSRNLSSELSWDLGLVLVGRSGVEGATAPQGLGRLVSDLWERAGLEIPAPGELEDLRWELPAAVENVRGLRLLLEDEARSLPDPPPGIRTLWAISPFLHGDTLEELTRWPCERRLLLTTYAEAAQVSARHPGVLERFDEVRVLERPEDEHSCGLGDEERDGDADAHAEDELLLASSWSLHAKAILAAGDEGAELWLGSPNLSRRGWGQSAAGHANAEAYAHLRVNQDFVSELTELLDQHARVLDRSKLVGGAVAESPEERTLELEHSRLAARWSVTQRAEGAQTLLESEATLHPKDERIELSVRPFARVSARGWQVWPRSAKRLTLVGVPWAEASELLEVQLSLGDQARRWVARAPFAAGPPDERDERVIVRWLGLRGWLAYVRSLLLGEDLSEADEVGDPGAEGPSSSRGALDLERLAPTLEEILRAWQREGSEVVERTHREIERYGRVLRDELEAEERATLDEFLCNWRTIVAGLGVALDDAPADPGADS